VAFFRFEQRQAIKVADFFKSSKNENNLLHLKVRISENLISLDSWVGAALAAINSTRR
jgi:hypothetical protein